MHQEEVDSRYEGPPLFEPRTPYHIDYTPRQVDKSLKFIPRMGQKYKFIFLDTIDYSADIVSGRFDLFAYKTAYFTKRNWHWWNHKIAHHLHHIWDELKKVGRGFKMLWQDFKFFVRF